MGNHDLSWVINDVEKKKKKKGKMQRSFARIYLMKYIWDGKSFVFAPNCPWNWWVENLTKPTLLNTLFYLVGCEVEDILNT